MEHESRLRTNGFTLVELAISLMVIGLLIGGILKGQELVTNARVTQTMRQITATQTAVTIFKNTYNAAPGDIKNRGARLPNCTSSPCNIAGNGNGWLDPIGGAFTGADMPVVVPFNNTGDRRNFWLHLAVANLITGVSTTGAASSPFDWGVEYPAAPFSGSGFTPSSVQLSNALYGTVNMPVAIAFLAVANADPAAPTRAIAQIDTKMDDGKPFTGDMRVPQDGASASSNCVTAQSPTGEYNQASTSGGCNLAININI